MVADMQSCLHEYIHAYTHAVTVHINARTRVCIHTPIHAWKCRHTSQCSYMIQPVTSSTDDAAQHCCVVLYSVREGPTKVVEQHDPTV